MTENMITSKFVLLRYLYYLMNYIYYNQPRNQEWMQPVMEGVSERSSHLGTMVGGSINELQQVVPRERTLAYVSRTLGKQVEILLPIVRKLLTLSLFLKVHFSKSTFKNQTKCRKAPAIIQGLENFWHKKQEFNLFRSELKIKEYVFIPYKQENRKLFWWQGAFKG